MLEVGGGPGHDGPGVEEDYEVFETGGTVCGIIPHENRVSLAEDEAYYGFPYKVVDEVKDGRLIIIMLHVANRPISSNRYILDPIVFRMPAEEAGMVSGPTIAPHERCIHWASGLVATDRVCRKVRSCDCHYWNRADSK